MDDCINHALCQVERYGFAQESRWRIADVEYLPDATRWNVVRDGRLWGEFEFSLAGEYNLLNATAAAAMASHYGITVEQIADGLQTFRSVKRRLEVRSDAYGVTIIDDFAHHPTAIAATLKALRARYGGRKLWAILEPRSNTLRRRVFQKELAQSLSIADEVVIAAIFKSEAVPEDERLHPETVVEVLRQAGIPAQLLPTADAIVDAVAPTLMEGDVVAILSTGASAGSTKSCPRG